MSNQPPPSTPREIKSICVFCGSSLGSSPEFAKAATELGKILAENGIKLVYGGGQAGLMGTIAKSVLENGGYAIGVLPTFMRTREIDYDGLSEIYYVETMHERKQKMASLADAFVAMPGGYGTFEELFEVITWTQLRLHSKPVLLLNTASYYTHLITFVDSAVSNGFIRPDLRKATLLAADEPGQVLDKLREWDGSGIPDILKEKKGVGMEGVEEGGDLSKV